MNKNVMIVLGGGLLIAALVTVLVKASIGGKSNAPTAAAEPPTRIIVAAKDLTVGQALTDEDLKWQDWPRASLFTGAIEQKDNKKPLEIVTGKPRRPIAAGEPVVESALIREGTGNFVAASLAKGMRAMAVEVDASRMAGGFITPGDYVDVMLTYKTSVNMPNGDNTDPRVTEMVQTNIDHNATETILQNARVMAVDQAAKRDETKDDGIVGKTVTLEVTSRGAEILALAGQMGSVSLALRKLGDNSISPPQPSVITDERLTHISKEVFAEAHKITGQGNNIVRIYNGYAVDQSTINP